MFNYKEIKKIKVYKKCRSECVPCSHNATVYYKDGQIDYKTHFNIYDATDCYDMLSLRNMFHFRDCNTF